MAALAFMGLTYKGISSISKERHSHNTEEERLQNYVILKKYLLLAEKNKVVTSYREIERLKTTGGGDEDPYDRHYRLLITEGV